MFIFKHNLIAALLTACFAVSLSAQECETALEDALESFSQQDYAQIIILLTDCPPERLLEKTKKIVANELLARAYFFHDQVDLAKGALNNLLDLQPGYEPRQPQYSERFIKLAEDLREERSEQQAKSIFRNKWLWAGGVAATSVAAFLIFNKQESKVLPEAPDPPDFQ